MCFCFISCVCACVCVCFLCRENLGRQRAAAAASQERLGLRRCVRPGHSCQVMLEISFAGPCCLCMVDSPRSVPPPIPIPTCFRTPRSHTIRSHLSIVFPSPHRMTRDQNKVKSPLDRPVKTNQRIVRAVKANQSYGLLYPAVKINN